jgi:internalin A
MRSWIGWCGAIALGVGLFGGGMGLDAAGKKAGNPNPPKSGQRPKAVPKRTVPAQPVKAKPAAPMHPFQVWCEGRSQLGLEAGRTIGVMLRAVGAQRCDRGTQALLKLKVLDLSGTGIQDLQPVGMLTELETLVLSRNGVKDLAAIGGLVKLKTLVVRGGAIADLSPLGNLVNLRELVIDGGKVQDLMPIARLKGLQTLSLQGHQIQNLAPLAGLRELGSLSLQNNQVSDLSPLTNMTFLRELRLDHNRVREVRSLSGLLGLEILTLNHNGLDESVFRDFATILPFAGLKRLELLGMPSRVNPCPILRSGSVCLFHRIPAS